MYVGGQPRLYAGSGTRRMNRGEALLQARTRGESVGYWTPLFHALVAPGAIAAGELTGTEQ